jgi:hypothetical protein
MPFKKKRAATNKLSQPPKKKSKSVYTSEHRTKQNRTYYLQTVASKEELGIVSFIQQKLAAREIEELSKAQALEQVKGPPSGRPTYRNPLFRKRSPTKEKAKEFEAWRVAMERERDKMLKAASPQQRLELAAHTILVELCNKAAQLDVRADLTLRQARAMHSASPTSLPAFERLEDAQLVILAACAERFAIAIPPAEVVDWIDNASHRALPVVEDILVQRHVTQVERQKRLKHYNEKHDTCISWYSVDGLFKTIEKEYLPTRSKSGLDGLLGCCQNWDEAKTALLQHPTHSLCGDYSRSKWIVWNVSMDGFVERIKQAGVSDILCSFKLLSGVQQLQQDRDFLFDLYLGRAKPATESSVAEREHLSGDTCRHIVAALVKHVQTGERKFTVPSYFPSSQLPSTHPRASTASPTYPYGGKSMVDIGYLGPFRGDPGRGRKTSPRAPSQWHRGVSPRVYLLDGRHG